MKRRLFNLTAAVSLVTLLTLTTLWLRSYWYGTLVAYDTEIGDSGVGWRYSLSMGSGMFRAVRKKDTLTGYFYHQRAQLQFYDHRIQGSAVRVFGKPPDVVGFDYGFSAGNGYLYQFVALPCWALVAMSGIMPALWFVEVIKARLRTPTGGCPTCGYDLRATPERCPECGSAIAHKHAEAAA